MAVTLIQALADSVIPVGMSQLGTIVFDNVEFPPGTFTNPDGKTVFYTNIKLDAVSLIVNRSKTIIKSMVSGRAGSVKEYITSSDYEINLTAVVAADTFSVDEIAQMLLGKIPGVSEITAAIGASLPKEPINLLYNLVKLEEVQDRVPVKSKFLQNIYDINYVVIETMSIEKTGPETYTLKMLLIGDQEVDLGEFDNGN